MSSLCSYDILCISWGKRGYDMKHYLQHPRITTKVLSFFLFLFLLQILLSASFVYTSAIQDIKKNLSAFTLRIQKDLKYNNGKWDTQLYNADPLTPYPNGSSGFPYPLYIVANNGFIIERSKPIKGLLDTSDFKHLIQFQIPQTIDGITSEKWRIYSKPILSNGKTIGAIVVSYYNPSSTNMEIIDKKLKDNLALIEASLRISNGLISVNKLDIRNIHYEFSFEVIDIYNNVLVNNGRVPTFVDRSYFSRELSEKRSRIVTDTNTSEKYYIVSHPIYSTNGEVVGLIVAGEEISKIYKTLQNYILFSIVVTIVLVLPLISYMSGILRKDIVILLSASVFDKLQVKKIKFDKKSSKIFLDKTSFSIPYASNQYYICLALFSHITKKWEYDELLEKIGDNSVENLNTRKVYDAVLAINKKVGIKIIEYEQKAFFLNPEILPLIEKI